MRGPEAYREFSLVLAALSLTACMAPVGTSGVISVPPDAAQTCAQHCNESATTTAGMATILMEQERQGQQVPPTLIRY